MKHKMLALILALSVMSWAQTATQTAPTAPQAGATEKSACPCCDKMASSSSKDGMSCARHKSADGKETASCCTGKDQMSCCSRKDAKSCMTDEKAAASCCGDKCSKDGKGCCSGKNEKSAMNCCEKHQHS